MKRTLLLISFLCLSSFLVTAQVNLTQVGKLSYNQDLSDVWGYATGANEYALVGVRDKFSIVDITTPSTPVEIFSEPGPPSTWRDIKVWNDHAYVIHDSPGGGAPGVGLLIVDLGPLPQSTALTTTYYTGSTYPWTQCHNLYIDENGILYIFGANNPNGVGGAIMYDLTNPTAPVELGQWDEQYIHDGMVRGDTLWASCLSSGNFAVDVSNKANPTTMVSWPTPNNFAHNCWVSDDGDYVYTTDEVSGAFIAGYDVSDFSNVTETDRIQPLAGSGVIPHNTHFIDEYLVTSYYTSGIRVTDVSRPDNMIEVGFFDTSPSFSGSGFNGDWGAYPWLPSGLILATDIEEGLYILDPTYQRACYLEGIVTDSVSGIPISGANIEILVAGVTEASKINGEYKTGLVSAGTYSVEVSKPGFVTKTVTGVSLMNGIVTMLDVELQPLTSISISGQVTEMGSGNPIPNAMVLIENVNFTYNATTDASGNFTFNTFFQGNYEISAGKWGYRTSCFSQQITAGPVNIQLKTGYYDDFTFDFGWTVMGTATAGIWERNPPVGTFQQGTPINPSQDIQTDCSDKAYVTGNGSTQAGGDDVDNGTTTLTSPVFDASTYANPYINYARWFANTGGFSTPNDTLVIQLQNGSTTAVLEKVDISSSGLSQWRISSHKISDFMTATSTMRIVITTSDLPGSGHLVEAGIDVFEVTEGGVGVAENDLLDIDISAYPNPFENSITIELDPIQLKNDAVLQVYDVTGRIVEEIAVLGNATLQVGNNLSAGIYNVSILNADKLSIPVKIIKTN